MCSGRVPMVTFEGAMRRAGIDQNDLLHLMEADQLHVTEMSTGQLFICVASLATATEPRRVGVATGQRSNSEEGT